MKITTRKSIALSAGLLALGGALNFAQPSQAAPRSYERGYREGRRDARRSWSGRVTKVRSSNSFDIRVGSDTFNVYTNARLPRRLNVGDRVSVNGVRQDSNDIRQARVSILRNR